ncbi:hypothetical protein Plhal304r1_c040g0118371 [Plasmopara halstedii]
MASVITLKNEIKRAPDLHGTMISFSLHIFNDPSSGVYGLELMPQIMT